MNTHNYIFNLCEKNKDKHLDKWTTYNDCFKSNGRQGITGLLDIQNTKIVFKLSQNIDAIIKHEYNIMKCLEDLYNYCPHFCRPYIMVDTDVDIKKSSIRKRKEDKDINPFTIEHKYPIKKEILLMEYINNSTKLTKYVYNDKYNNYHIIQTVKQILSAIHISQLTKKFTHYDLHSDNIMIKKINPDIVNYYIINNDTQYCVPTLGLFPTIIDFGFSFCKDTENNPLFASLTHTDVGFISVEYDWVSDPKLLLTSISYDLIKNKKDKVSKSFYRIVDNMFSSLSLDKENGWDNKYNKSLTEYIGQKIKSKEIINSTLFEKLTSEFTENLMSMIILPLKKYNYDNLNLSFNCFIKEFNKIESRISNPIHQLYILKNIVTLGRQLKKYYLDTKTREKTISIFRKKILEIIDKVSSFFTVNINWELMLCSLYELCKNIEGYLYHKIDIMIRIRNKEYSNLQFNNISKIYDIIDYNIPCKYIYNKNTIVNIYNLQDKKTYCFKNLDKTFLKMLNNIQPLYISKLMYLYFQHNKNKI